jgi:hypothetical protein
MVYSSVNDLVLIGFRGQLKFLRWGSEHESLEEVEEQTIQLNFLTHLVLNYPQKVVALGIENNSTKQNIIELYEFSQK